MDNKTLAKLALLAKKDPKLAASLEKQASAVSDADLARVTGGDACAVASCWFSSTCWTDASKTDAEKTCESTTKAEMCKSLF